MADDFPVLYTAHTKSVSRWGSRDIHHLTHDYVKTLCGHDAIRPYKLQRVDDRYPERLVSVQAEIVAGDHWINDDNTCKNCLIAMHKEEQLTAFRKLV